MPVGRPPKFKSPEELEALIEGYFQTCKEEKRPYTILGLAIYLDVDRCFIRDYGRKDQFTPTIKRAKAKIENYAEEKLFDGKATAGVIFNLANNYPDNWKNKQFTENKTINLNKDITELSDEELDKIISNE